MAYTEQEMRRILAEDGPAVYKLALAYTRTDADADDIYQEVFLRLIKAQPALRDERHRRAWLLRVAINCCKDHVKRAAYRLEQPLDDREPAAPAAEEYDALNEALAALPPIRRTLIHLFYYEGYRTEEIARLTGLNASTVRSHLKRARKQLRDWMEGENG